MKTTTKITTEAEQVPCKAVELPTTGFLRLPQIIGDESRGLLPLVPVSKSGWWLGIRKGIYPQGVKLSSRVTVWRVSDIRALLEAETITLNRPGFARHN